MEGNGVWEKKKFYTEPQFTIQVNHFEISVFNAQKIFSLCLQGFLEMTHDNDLFYHLSSLQVHTPAY